MRTFKRYSLPLNTGKWQQLCQLARLFRAEKNEHLKFYNRHKNYIAAPSERPRRDALVQLKYRSKVGLQARQWKQALTEAYDTVEKLWAARAEEIRPLVNQHKKQWSEEEMHYAYWLLFSPKRLAAMRYGTAPVPQHFNLGSQSARKVRNYFRRVLRRKIGNPPHAHLARSIPLDANMYSLFEHMGVQYITIMSQEPRKRVVVPLTGHSHLSGNIRIVLDLWRKRVEVHAHAEVDAATPREDGPVLALDAGLSEVFTDQNGERYAPGFGATLAEISEATLQTGKARNQALALYKKTSSPGKRARILKNNLGRRKLRSRRRKAQARIKQQISHAIRLVAEKKPARVVTESLDIRGKAKNKKMARQVSQWLRSSLKERMQFLALAEGFRHQQVNPSFTSQMCPTCLFVSKNNRRGDIFKCGYCGHTDDADRVAAQNLKARSEDPEITVYTPVPAVKAILDRRFKKQNGLFGTGGQLFSGCPACPTVSGQTDGNLLVPPERNSARQSSKTGRVRRQTDIH